jgi:ribonuclease P protein component
MDVKFPKRERLHSRKLIKELFDKGSSFFIYPFKVICLPYPAIETNQVLISVSKKKIKKAVHRNLMKRRIKEAYRLNKWLLKPSERPKQLIALVYVSSDLMAYDEVQRKISKCLKKIIQTK